MDELIIFYLLHERVSMPNEVTKVLDRVIDTICKIVNKANFQGGLPKSGRSTKHLAQVRRNSLRKERKGSFHAGYIVRNNGLRIGVGKERKALSKSPVRSGKHDWKPIIESHRRIVS